MNESVHSFAPSVGSLVGGRYRLDELAGSGGMAQVWAATDTVLGRRVAVKMLHPHLRHDESLVRRFRQEGRLSARLTDPNIVAVFDTVATIDADAIVMELVEGSTLRRLLDERGRLDVATVVDIGCKVADALAVAHHAHLTHRDIKPANILLCADGGVKVADFGIAKTGDLEDLTRDGSVIGTATYLAPEQLRGEPTDTRSDLYSLGVVLYEAVCGRPPFTGETEAARAVQRLTHTPTPPHRVVGDVPLALSQFIMRALERNPDLRPATAGAFRAELADCLTPTAPQLSVPAVRRSPTRPPATSNHRPRSRAPRRSRLGIVVLVLLIGGALALIAALLQQGTPLPRPGQVDPRDRGSTTAGSSAPISLPIQSVTTFDPDGSGTPGENDHLIDASHDGNTGTAWRTEGYQRREFGTKSGVGVLIELARAHSLTRLAVTSPTTGWRASVEALDTTPTTAPDPGATGATGAVAGTTSFPLAGARGRVVLLWITRLGSGGPPFRVDISELELFGSP